MKYFTQQVENKNKDKELMNSNIKANSISSLARSLKSISFEENCLKNNFWHQYNVPRIEIHRRSWKPII